MLRIALPNKGRLSEEALALFETAGLKANFSSSRALMADMGQGYDAIFVRAADIPEFVADGAADVGVTGHDLVIETGRDVEELIDLGFGRCRLAVAVPENLGISSVSELPARTRIATSFPGVATRFFESKGVDIEIAEMSGAVEIAPHLGMADAIVDLVSTGSTLKVNRLVEIETIVESTARVIANRGALADDDRGRMIERLSTALQSVLRARAKRYLMANVPRAKLDEVRKVVPGMNGPTIVDVLDADAWVAVHVVVDEERVFDTISELKELGAEGILVSRIERITP